MSKWTLKDPRNAQCFAIKGGEIYEVIGLCEKPTLIFQNVKTGAISHHVPEAPNTEKFVKLVPEYEKE